MNDHAGPHWNEPSPLPDRRPPMPESALTINEYQRRAKATAVYREGIESLLDSLTHEELVDLLCKLYLTLGAMDELGELASIYKRFLRDGTIPNPLAVLTELGDQGWYETNHVEEYGARLSDVKEYNLNKLADRASRGTIKGKGDER